MIVHCLICPVAFFVLQPQVGQGLLIHEVSISHKRGITFGRTPLDERSARRRDLCLTTHNTHNKQISMPPEGFEPTISAGERTQTYALDRVVTGTGPSFILPNYYLDWLWDIWNFLFSLFLFPRFHDVNSREDSPVSPLILKFLYSYSKERLFQLLYIRWTCLHTSQAQSSEFCILRHYHIKS